jgi:putative SbcD/Mre11-related phosphoesterase
MSESSARPSVFGFEPWQLTPEGAAIHVGERTALIADVHLGYEWARGDAGDCVPAHSLAETLARLERLLARAKIARLIVAGDLVESHRACPQTAAECRRLAHWLSERGVSLTILQGNHDRSLSSSGMCDALGGAPLPETCSVAGWTIGHGHRRLGADRTISGHLHPVARLGGLTAGCFLAGPGRIILPAFSSNAAGWNVLNGRVSREWIDLPVRCIVCAGNELLDFGLLRDLRRRRPTL